MTDFERVNLTAYLPLIAEPLRRVYEAIESGATYKQAGENLALSQSRVAAMYHQAIRDLTYQHERMKHIMSVNNPLQIQIEYLPLGVRAYNGLKISKIDTVGELVSKPVTELLKIRNFGHKAIQEIQQALKEFGLSLQDYESRDGLPQPLDKTERLQKLYISLTETERLAFKQWLEDQRGN